MGSHTPARCSPWDLLSHGNDRRKRFLLTGECDALLRSGDGDRVYAASRHAPSSAVLTFPWRRLGNGLKTFVGLPKKSATISFLLNILLREWQIPHRARYDGGLSG